MMKYRRNHLDAMNRALKVIDEIDVEFARTFGRRYGGCLEEYRMEDAEIALITIGGMSGAGKDAVDIMRENGVHAGLVRLRFIRPFPADRIREALSKVKAFAVVDRSVSFGWSQGPMHMEVKAALADCEKRFCHFSAIGGLGGADISVKHMKLCLEKLNTEKSISGEKPTVWLLGETGEMK